MDLCTQCGAELGIGRFCTNCGHPVSPMGEAESWRTDTAERPRVTLPPQDPSEPGPARFPLYAEEEHVTEPPSDQVPDDGARGKPPHHRDERRVIPWLAGLTLLAAVGGVGLWLLLDPDDEPSRATDPPATSTPTGERSSEPSAEPDPEPTATRRPYSPGADPSDLAGTTTVEAPAPAPASQDSDGNRVTYVATNMIDGIDETTWRMPGDGTGEAITFRLESPAVLSEVGLINGYAKVGEDSGGFLDWYAGNRRVLEVQWTFDDGTVVNQVLRESAAVQVIRIDEVETESVTLRLLEVTAPGVGRASRDYTAISEVSLVGVAS